MDIHKRRFTAEQINRFINQVEAGMWVADLCRQHGLSGATFYQWRAKCCDMDMPDARRLKALKAEND